jgi:predicted secreted protein
MFFSNLFLVLPIVIFFQSEVDQVSFGCTITPPPTYFIIFYFKTTVFEILICLLHIPLGEQIYFGGPVLGNYAASVCSYWLTFWDSQFVPFSEVKQTKKNARTTGGLKHVCAPTHTHTHTHTSAHIHTLVAWHCSWTAWLQSQHWLITTNLCHITDLKNKGIDYTAAEARNLTNLFFVTSLQLCSTE